MNFRNAKASLQPIAALASLLSLLAAPLALADTSASQFGPERSMTVHFADLNLSSPEGARALYSRIRSAAASLCGEQFSLWDGNRPREWATCYRTTIERAVMRVNYPTVTAAHREATQQSASIAVASTPPTLSASAP
ncbi:MAG: UrcA family protein [Terriglobales bacterium]